MNKYDSDYGVVNPMIGLKVTKENNVIFLPLTTFSYL